MNQIHYIRQVISTFTVGMVLAGVLCAAWVTAHAEKPTIDFDNVPGVGHPPTGRDLYQVSCAACHGVDGSGASRDRVGFDQALPDFTDCNFATREANLDWIAVAQEGGPARFLTAHAGLWRCLDRKAERSSHRSYPDVLRQ